MVNLVRGWNWRSDEDDAAPMAAAVTAAPPVFDTGQIVQQLRTSWGGTFEGTTQSWAGTGAINYYIGGLPYVLGGAELLSWIPMTTVMIVRATLAFELWDDLIARDLTPVALPASSQIQFEYASQTSGGGTYTRPTLAQGGTNEYGTANYNIVRSEIWLNSKWSTHDQDSDLYFGGYGFQTYMHEIGHSLGLSHPGTYNAAPGVSISYANNAEFSQDNRQYTIMSYFGGYQLGTGWQQDGASANWYYPETPMLYDIAAIQAIYGADTTTRIGDTTYGFNNNSGRDVFDFTIDTHPIFTIWDAGGNDTLDTSGFAAAQRIDLHAGTYSDIGGMINNIAIAFDATIENAIGGSGNDTITGNGGDNVLRGGRGNDALEGGGGSDTAAYSGGRAGYAITFDTVTFNFTVVDLRSGAPDGRDVVHGMTFFQFADGTVDAVSLTARTVNNTDGTRTVTVYDAPDHVPWHSHASIYDGVSRLLSETFNEDNGTRWTNSFSGGNPALWTTTNLDVNGNLVSQTQTNANGTHMLTGRDAAGAANWLDFTMSFDADWNVVSETGRHDDGTPLSPTEIGAAFDTIVWFTHPVDPARDFLV